MFSQLQFYYNCVPFIFIYIGFISLSYLSFYLIHLFIFPILSSILLFTSIFLYLYGFYLSFCFLQLNVYTCMSFISLHVYLKFISAYMCLNTDLIISTISACFLVQLKFISYHVYKAVCMPLIYPYVYFSSIYTYMYLILCPVYFNFLS